MWDCESELRKLAGAIEPSATQKSDASRSHNYLRDMLDAGEFGNRILDSYLSGSYARGTAIAPIDDVDIIVVVDPEGWPRRFLNSHPEPDRILQSFARAIRYRYPQSSVRVQRRSVRLNLYHLNIDVVPAVEVDGGDHRIEIPDAESDDWIRSAPKMHTQIAADINQAQGGRFKPLVKLLKSWNSALPETANLKSFAVETIAARLFKNVGLPRLQDGLRFFFDFLAEQANQGDLYEWSQNYGIQLNWWTHEVLDLAGTRSNVVAKLDSERRKKFLGQAIRSRDALIDAEKARNPEYAVRHIRSALRM